MLNIIREVINAEHPIYTRRKAEWQRNEARYRAGRHVEDELIPFDWETLEAGFEAQNEAALQELVEQQLLAGKAGKETHFQQRKRLATFPSLPKRMAQKFVGHLAAEAPKPGEGYDFAGLGSVREPEDLRAPYSRGELVYFDADKQGTHWTAFFNEVQRWAMVTGHRWIGTTSPPGGAATQADEQRGQRPYLVHLSPLDVPNWHFGAEGLDFLVLDRHERVLVKNDQYHGKTETLKLLYIRQGFATFGDAYAAGGWWLLDKDGIVQTTPDGTERRGDLEATQGIIPYCPFYYEQDQRDLSRSGTEEVGRLAAEYMNVRSAGMNDLLVGGGRSLFALGVDKGAHDQASKQIAGGSRFIGVPAGRDGTVPTIYDTGQVSIGEGVNRWLSDILTAAATLAQDELLRSPDASGAARRIEFLGTQVPMLSQMAYNREQAENFHLRMIALHFGVSNGPRVLWKKKFDLESTVEDWMALFDAAARVNATSPTLAKEGLRGIAKDKSLTITEEAWKQIDAEIDDSADAEAQSRALDRTQVFA